MMSKSLVIDTCDECPFSCMEDFICNKTGNCIEWVGETGNKGSYVIPESCPLPEF